MTDPSGRRTLLRRELPRRKFPRPKLLAGGAAAIALFLIGTSAPASAELGDYSVFGSQTLRYLIASTVLIVVLAVRTRGRLPRLAWPDAGRMLLLSVFGFAAFNFGLITATRSADPALIGMVLAATPVVLAVLGPLQQRRRPAPLTVLGAVVVAAGTAVASGLGHADPAGIAWSLVALASEVAFSLLAVPLIRRYGALTVTTYAGATSVPVMLVTGLLVDGPDRLFGPMTGRELFALLYVALVVAVVANVFWYAALSRLPADRAGLCYAFTPVGALLGGLLVGRSSWSAAPLIGLAGVGLGLLVGLWRPRRPDHRHGADRAVEDWSSDDRGGPVDDLGREGRDGADPAGEPDGGSSGLAVGRLGALSAQHGGGPRTAELDAGRSARR